MDLTAFYEQVEAHELLMGVGVDHPDGKAPGVIVEHTPSRMATRLPAEAIEKAEWGVIEEILLGKRDPVVLQHMTRVVGYYSRVENWNKSKVGELKDRHAGVYAVAGEA